MAVSSLLVPVGAPAPDFALLDLAGTTVRRDDFGAAPALLVVFVCNHCPYVLHIEAELSTVLASCPSLAVGGSVRTTSMPIRRTDPSAWPSRPGVRAGSSRTDYKDQLLPNI
jgi:hypothetical protein